MKKLNLRFAIALLALLFVTAGNAFAQDVPMVGGFKTVSVTDQAVVYAANFASKKIGESKGIDLKMESILKAEQQVVQGMNYNVFFRSTYVSEGKRYQTCLNARVYRSLQNVFTLSNWKAFECPVSVPMVGGFKSVSVEDRAVVYAANFAMKKIGADEEMELKLVSILKAEQQVVQGMNYRILFETTYFDGGEEYQLCLTAQVYRSLKNVYTLSKWSSQECPE